jgi:predicted RNase H-like HicB family nuclease
MSYFQVDFTCFQRISGIFSKAGFASRIREFFGLMDMLNYHEMHIQHMAKQKFTVIIERDEDGMYIGTVPAFKGCYSDGASLDELMSNINEAISAHLAVQRTI